LIEIDSARSVAPRFHFRTRLDMASVKHFIVIGLGSFGTALAEKLSKNGCRVTGLDTCKTNVEALKNTLYEAIIGDATDRETLEQISLANADAVFISMGEDIAKSLLATLHARELGAKRVVVKGVTAEHGRILRSLGVQRVIFPEIEIAEELADRETWTNVVDFLPIDPEYSFVEMAVPDSFIGQSLQAVNLRRRFGVWVVGIKDAMSGKLQMFPDGDYQFMPDQLLLVVGKRDEIDALRAVK
jgi:trk system potassium uptake protein TrkA